MIDTESSLTYISIGFCSSAQQRCCRCWLKKILLGYLSNIDSLIDATYTFLRLLEYIVYTFSLLELL